MHVFGELISPFNCSCHTFACSCCVVSLSPSLRSVLCLQALTCVSSSCLSGVPGFQRVGPIRHQVHAKRDVQPAAVSTEVTAVRHGGRGRAEQPCPVSTAILHCLALRVTCPDFQTLSRPAIWPGTVLVDLIMHRNMSVS